MAGLILCMLIVLGRWVSYFIMYGVILSLCGCILVVLEFLCCVICLLCADACCGCLCSGWLGLTCRLALLLGCDSGCCLFGVYLLLVGCL